MLVVEPINVTDAVLKTSNIAENEYPTWTELSTYAADENVIYKHIIYKSLQNTNKGNNPITSTAFWKEIGATNKFAMFDAQNATKTKNNGNIEVVLDVPVSEMVINTIALLEVQAEKVSVKITDKSAGVIYDKEFSLIDNRHIKNIYDYFFKPIKFKRNLIVSDLPNYVGCEFEIKMIGSKTECGTCLLGRETDLGQTYAGSNKTGITDYSTKENNAFGVAAIVERDYAKRGSFTINAKTEDIDYLQDFLSTLRARACLYIGHKDQAVMCLYGFYKDFSINIDYPEYSELIIEIEGLV